MNCVNFLLLFGLFCFSLTQGYPLSPGSFTDLRFYRILGSRHFPRAGGQWLPSKRSLIFPSFYNQGQKRDSDHPSAVSGDFDPSDLAIKFGKRGKLSARDRFWLGKRASLQKYENAFPDHHAAELAVRFG